MYTDIRIVEVNGFPHYEDSDGFRVPVIAGGSDGGVSVTDQIQDALTAGETEEVGTDESVETLGSQEQDQVETNPDSLANDFLKGIPEADKAVVAKYIKDWDAGVTKKFQEIHGTYAPYKQLGDPEKLSQANQLYDLLEQNPQLVYEALKQQFGEEAANEAMQQQQQEPDEFTQMLTPVQEQIQQQQQMLEQLATIILGNEQQSKQQQEDQQLADYLGNLKQAHGEFDDHFVLAKMAAGISGEDAVKQYQNLINSQLQQQAQAGAGVPPVLSGNGAPPAGRSVTDLNDKDVKALVANLVGNQEK